MGEYMTSSSKPVRRHTYISVLIIIAGLYLGLFLVNNVEQYQNQKITDAARH
jgi:hypothetical protein